MLIEATSLKQISDVLWIEEERQIEPQQQQHQNNNHYFLGNVNNDWGALHTKANINQSGQPHNMC